MDVHFYITPAAHEAICHTLAQRGHGLGIRICFPEGADGGVRMGMEFADTVSESECCLDAEGFMVAVACTRLPRLHGMRLDFRREAGHSGFHLAPVESCATCSCGGDPQEAGCTTGVDQNSSSSPPLAAS